MKNYRSHFTKARLTVNNHESCSLTTEYEDNRFLTAREAAEYLSVPYASVLNMSSSGQLPYYKLGKRNRYLVSDLKQLLLSERRGPEGGAYGNKME
jgi:excisionase family DNA binding protein